MIGEFASGELGLTNDTAFAVTEWGRKVVHRTLQTVSAEALRPSTDVALHLHLTVVIKAAQEGALTLAGNHPVAVENR